MIVGVAEKVALVQRFLAVEAGDMIASGALAGTGDATGAH
jgi:2-keto-4-pentenoate hydratase/2-oxohepta-3-ene-1,7-dioic acid hydratase in catechol pathway